MRTISRIVYDEIARLYDAQPYRGKTVDPELAAFLGQHGSSDHLSLLDLACGTGSQLLANRSIVPDARLVGVDRSRGMLAQGKLKNTGIVWVQADAAALPFMQEGFDYVSCQFAFHHVPDKTGMLREVFRVLRPGGRFVMHNLSPQDHPDWLYYEYFSESQAIDREDFWPLETIVATMKTAGFVAISFVHQHIRFEQNLHNWLDAVRQRAMNSQLMAISDSAYETGIRRLERETADGRSPQVRPDHICLLTLRGDRYAQTPIRPS